MKICLEFSPLSEVIPFKCTVKAVWKNHKLESHFEKLSKYRSKASFSTFFQSQYILLWNRKHCGMQCIVIWHYNNRVWFIKTSVMPIYLLIPLVAGCSSINHALLWLNICGLLQKQIDCIVAHLPLEEIFPFHLQQIPIIYREVAWVSVFLLR